jgi:hypothetical protein
VHSHAGAAAAAASFVSSSPLVSEVYPRTGLEPSPPCPAPCAPCDPPTPPPITHRRLCDTFFMYTHAVQSLVFNRCCSFRLAPPNSPTVMLGDLVGVGVAAGGGGEGAEERGPGDVVEVTAENISQYTLADVVLPLPGKDVRYPSNSTGEEYKRVLAELSIENAFTGSHVKELNLSGAYRRIVCMPQGDQPSLGSSCDKWSFFGRSTCDAHTLDIVHSTLPSLRSLSALRPLRRQRRPAAAHRRRRRHSSRRARHSTQYRRVRRAGASGRGAAATTSGVEVGVHTAPEVRARASSQVMRHTSHVTRLCSAYATMLVRELTKFCPDDA